MKLARLMLLGLLALAAPVFSQQLIVDPLIQAIDANGNPISGAKLHIDDAGTSTDRTTYSDSALTTPNANPMIADASGRFGPIFLAPSGTALKLTLDTSADVNIWTQDNVPAASVTAAAVGLALYPQSALESAASVTPTSYQYEWGNVLRYGCAGDGSTDDLTCFTNALLTGHEVYIPVTSDNKYVVSDELTITEGTVLRGESRETVLSYTGSAGTYLLNATLVTMEKGLTIDNITLESATNGVNGIKCIECRNAHITRVNLVPDSGGDDFAIGILFDDDAASSPQVGTAWNYMEDYYIEGATDACLRLDTQGTLTWANRNFIGHGRLEGCNIGLDLVRGDTNIIFANPQNSGTGIALGADADYNYLVSFEETSSTASITVAAGAVRNTIIGSYATGTITDNGTNNLWLAQSYYRIPALTDGTLKFEQASGNANISIPAGFTGNINFSVQDSDGPTTTQVMSLVGDVSDPYVSVPTRLNATYLGTTPTTTAALNDISDAINTNDGKVDGACVWDSTADIIMCATGAADGSTWVGEKAGSTITLTPS